MAAWLRVLVAVAIAAVVGGALPLPQRVEEEVESLLSAPNAFQSTPDLVSAEGLSCESHVAVTSDGYKLTMHRIPRHGAPAVYLQHGLEDASHTWVINGRSSSLAFVLYDAGFDVWMGNSRGNVYSTAHTTLSTDSKEFWAFSYDEMAKYDMPAQINTVLAATGHSTLGYVGHSQGTLQGFIAFSNPDVASKVNVFVALSPVAYLNHVGSMLLSKMADLHLDTLFKIIGMKRFLTSNVILQTLLGGACSVSPSLCENGMCALMGCNKADWNSSRFALYMSDDPAGTSVQNMVHFSQSVRSGLFQAYDYGSAASNQAHYGQPTPPNYSLKSVIPPTALVCGGQDDLADPTDVARLRAELPKPVMDMTFAEWSHLDPIWGMDAAARLYPALVDLLKKHAGK